MEEKYIITLKADDRPGLVHLVTGMINRRLINIESINAAKTDVRTIVTICIEATISEKALQPILLKLKNIVEVYDVEAVKFTNVTSLRSAYFKLSKGFLETPKALLLPKFGASIVNLYPDAILVSKSGCDQEILNFYNQLEGIHLLGFIQTGLIADTTLIENDESSVIYRAA